MQGMSEEATRSTFKRYSSNGTVCERASFVESRGRTTPRQRCGHYVRWNRALRSSGVEVNRLGQPHTILTRGAVVMVI